MNERMISGMVPHHRKGTGMAEPHNVIVFKATQAVLQFWPSEWRPPPRALVFAGYAMLYGLGVVWFFIFIPFLVFLWLISGLAALALPFDPEIDLANLIGGTLLLAGLFVWGCFLLPSTLRHICFLRDERFVIDPAAREVRWEKDYSRGPPSRSALSFDAISGVSERGLCGAETGDFHGVGLDVPTTRGRRKWRMVAVHDLPQDARETADRLRAALHALGWKPLEIRAAATTAGLSVVTQS
jgi:hypothetical protein